MDEGLLFVDIFIVTDDAAFSGTVGAGKSNIADFSAGKYVTQGFPVMMKVNRVIGRQRPKFVLKR
nr:hypothetical protein [uncultured Oscillibacter sp.]